MTVLYAPEYSKQHWPLGIWAENIVNYSLGHSLVPSMYPLREGRRSASMMIAILRTIYLMALVF